MESLERQFTLFQTVFSGSEDILSVEEQAYNDLSREMSKPHAVWRILVKDFGTTMMWIGVRTEMTGKRL